MTSVLGLEVVRAWWWGRRVGGVEDAPNFEVPGLGSPSWPRDPKSSRINAIPGAFLLFSIQTSAE